MLHLLVKATFGFQPLKKLATNRKYSIFATHFRKANSLL